MLRLQNIGLTQGAVTDLQAWQAIVDGMPTFPGQVTEAKRQFKLKNTRSNPAFQVVRSALTQMHGELIRCAYCEDSVADEVEHIYPKDLYPERVFVWENYTYACGPCNGPKSNRFAIFLATDGSEVDISPPKRKPQGWIPARPPKGDALLIDPRNENPLDFLWLDLGASCRIDPKMGLSRRATRRAEYPHFVLNGPFAAERANDHGFWQSLSPADIRNRKKMAKNRCTGRRTPVKARLWNDQSGLGAQFGWRRF